MTLKEAIALHGEPVSVEEVSTCNAWGFGGWYGKRHTFANGFVFEQGRVSTRHQGTFPMSRLRDDKGITVSRDNGYAGSRI